MRLTRRQVIIGATALPLIACKRSDQKDAPAIEQASPYQFFQPTEARTVDAWLEQLLPAGIPEGTPGARDAHVLEYMDRELKKPNLSRMATAVRRGAVLLERAAQEQGAAHFADLPVDAQRELLGRFQSGALSTANTNTAKVFNAVLLLALEGFLGDPSHGGNHEGKVWASLGNSPACPHQ